MGNSKNATDQEFIAIFQQHGAAETAKIVGTNVRNVYLRRASLEAAYGMEIQSPGQGSTRRGLYEQRLGLRIQDGNVIIGSDVHKQPGRKTTAHRGMVHLIKELKPKILMLNGDVLDGASVSRHPPIGWQQPITLREELDAVEEFTDELRTATNGAKLVWTLGNHDMRFENALSGKNPQYGGIRGFSLKDHFPHWQFGWSFWLNDGVVVKHRFKGGIHATHNNTLWSGKTMVTGHLHSLKVTPFTDYNGIRWGIDTGTMDEPEGQELWGDEFLYTEENPLNWRSGFVVLTFHKGELLWPEIVRAADENHIDFRGKLIRV